MIKTNVFFLYIECLQDKAILPEDQKRMYVNAGCDVITLNNADHSPFLSTPAALSDAILLITSETS